MVAQHPGGHPGGNGGPAFRKETDLSRAGGAGGPNRGNTFVVGVPAEISVGGGGAGTPAPAREKNIYEKSLAYLQDCGIEPTPDAVRQLSQVFLPCLKIMSERPWDPEGDTWRRSGIMGILTDIRKKFERLWERGWKKGQRHDDSAYDLINYVGMYLRSRDDDWGEWGQPYRGPEE